MSKRERDMEKLKKESVQDLKYNMRKICIEFELTLRLNAKFKRENHDWENVIKDKK